MWGVPKILQRLLATIFIVLGFLGSIDFIVGKTRDLGWIRKVIDFLITPMGRILLIIGGFVWIIWTLKKPTIKSPIAIDYIEDDPRFVHEVKDIKTAHYGQHHRIRIKNLTNETIEDVSIELTGMQPLHKVFERQIPLPLKKSINLHPGDKFIPVIQWVWVVGTQLEYYEIITRYSAIGTQFTVDDSGHEIELTFRGKNLQPIARKFKFGITRIPGLADKFWFKAV